MANTILPAYTAAEMEGLALDLADAGVDLIFLLVNSGTQPADDALEFIGEIASGAEISRTGALQNKAVTAPTYNAGVVQQRANLTCDAIELPDAGGAEQGDHVYLAHDTGDDATSRLLVRWDTGINGAPLTPDGVNDTIQAASANGLFSL